MRKRMTAVLLCVLLCAQCVSCAGLPRPPASEPLTDAARPPFLFAQEEPEPAEAARKPGDGLPVLDVPGDSAFDAAVRSWTFGGARDEQNRPLACVAAQRDYTDLGLVSFGPDETSVYLTFDFGYETGYSWEILDILQKKEAKATFFITGQYLDTAGDAVARMAAEGHSVGGHSETHPGAPGGVAALPQEQRVREIEAVAGRLADEYGYETCLFRFPEGIYSEAALADAASHGQHSVFWSYAYADWDAQDQPPVLPSLEKALDAACPGAVYLLHPQKTNAAILGSLIDGLRERGYEPVAL